MPAPALMDAPESSAESKTPVASVLPDARVLEDKTPTWFRTTPTCTLMTLVTGLLAVAMTHVPLWHTDLWDHINYGQQVLDHGNISRTEPLLKLAQGMPMVNVPWLAQIGLASLNNSFGLAALQFAFGLTVAGCLGLVAWRTIARSGSTGAGILAVSIFLALNYHQFMIIRPQLVGLLFYCVLVAWLFSARPCRTLTWFAMPFLFVVWANCHGSFAIGLMLMGLAAAGRFCDIWLRSRSLRLAFLDSRADQTILLTQLCAVAALVNPSGMAIYPEVFHVAGNANVDTMFEWSALTLRSQQGQCFAVMLILLLTAMKLSPRRVRLIEVFPLIATGLLTLWSARMINWWAPVCAIVTATHLTAVVRQLRKRPRSTAIRRPTGLWTIVSLGLCWILFALTNFGVQIVHGRMTEPQKMVSRQTPLQLVEYLNSKTTLPDGIAFVPAEWAGFVMHAGPPSLTPMVNLHVHVIPEEVWNDYLRVLHGPSDWDAILDQYGMNLVIADKLNHAGLVRRLSESEDWTARYQDNLAIVFTRNQPI